MPTYDAIVVGAGFAGLTTARELGEAGLNVLVLEGRDRQGGRTFYRPFTATGKNLEFGGTWLCPSYQPYVQAELDRYGIELHQSPTPTRFGWALESELITARFPVPVDQWAALERAVAYLDAQASRLRFGEDTLAQPGLEDLDVPFSEFVAALGLPRRAYEFIITWSGLYFGAYPEQVSALHVLSWIAGWKNSSVAAFTELSDKVVGGMSTFTSAIAGDVKGEIRLGAPVASIEQIGDEVRVSTRDGEVHTAKAAVVTAPVNTWDNIRFDPPLEGSHAAIAEEKQAGQAVKVWSLVRGLEDDFYGIGSDTVFKWLAAEYHTEDGTYLVGFTAAAADLDPTDLEAVTAAVHQFLPEVEVVAAEAHDWNADEFSRGTWMAYRPGQVFAHAVGIQQTHGRIAFANSDLASGWAGWIDGALETAFKAAEQVKGWVGSNVAEVPVGV